MTGYVVYDDLQEEIFNVILSITRWNMKREMYCWRRIQLQVLLLFMAWLRLSSHNSNKQQAIQTGLKRRKSIKSISSKLIELMDHQTRRVVETVNSYQEVQPCFFYIFASFWTFACTEMDGIWQLHSFFSGYYLIKSPPATVRFTGSRPDQMSPSGTLTTEENHI